MLKGIDLSICAAIYKGLIRKIITLWKNQPEFRKLS